MAGSLIPRQGLGAVCLFGGIVAASVLTRAHVPRPPAPPLPQVGASAAVPHGPAASPPGAEGAAKRQEPQRITVHVVGCVFRPGVYSFSDGARVVDAVRSAGGAKPNADLEQINLAARLADGAQLLVPRRGAPPPRPPSRRTAARPRVPMGRMDFTEPAPLAPIPPLPISPAETEKPSGRERASVEHPDRPQKLKSPAEGRVNINSASLDELQRLPHVGPATAQKIIDYRDLNGPFRSVEQLLEIRGIGKKRLAELRPFIEL